MVLFSLALSCCIAQPQVDFKDLPTVVDPQPHVISGEVPAVVSQQDGPMIGLEIDYLFWYLERLRVPALVTTGPSGSQAILNEPGTAIVYGDDRLPSRHDRYVGIRFRGDVWLNEEQTIGLNGTVFILERDSSNRTIGYNTISPLARPYTDAATGTQQSLIIAGNSPGIGTLIGGFNAYSRIELFGEDLNGVWELTRGPEWRLGFLAGGRFLQMRERLRLTGTSKVEPQLSEILGVTDQFDTFDKFYGVQIGLLADIHLGGRFSLSVKATTAVGGDDQMIEAKGNRVDATPGQRLTKNYGLYVLPSNEGSFERGAVDGVGELNLTLTYKVTERLSLRCGYSGLIWLNPVRAGDQITAINLSQVEPGGLVGPMYPRIPFKEDLFWAHGGQVGLELTW